ncbi:MAG: DUF721 domain-containing protein [Desulfovibrio sp.]|nr:DUF721 domain-containing protein [Desulfovibrio sp.]
MQRKNSTTKKESEKRTGFNANRPRFSFTEYLQTLDREEMQSQLCQLWACWKPTLGPELSAYALPLGHKKRELYLGCLDSVALQDLRLQEAEILSRVNAFLGKKYFTKVRVELLLGKTDLSEPKTVKAPQPAPESEAFGTYLAKMKASSPVARCYQAFVAAKNGTKPSSQG